MTYDPNKIEEWVVGSNSFWRKGAVNEEPGHIVPFTGTWAQVKARSEEMARMEARHYFERGNLQDQQREERKTLWG